MHRIKWLLVLELYIVAVAVSLTGDEWSALAFAIGATLALLVALELDDDRDDEVEQSISVDRLALILSYAWTVRSALGGAGAPHHERYCSLAANMSRYLGEVTRGERSA